MKTDSLNYELPPELIAQQPAASRSDSRLLVLQRPNGRLADRNFSDLPSLLKPGDCLVLNNTRVLPARFFARCATGGRLEGLFLSPCPDGTWLVMLKGARKLKPAERFILKDTRGDDFSQATLVEKQSEGRCIIAVAHPADPETILDRIGFPPLPPYIRRDADHNIAEQDRLRYQTVYAERSGAVAAPTAGLHFTDRLLERLRDMAVVTAYVTLHVGAGTFKPVTAERLEDHDIHEEWFRIDARNAETINRVRHDGGRIVAVGTTSVRTLESAAANGRVSPFSGNTKLFITPGYQFRIVDAIITNFHLPRSTLLALVAAFAGLENVMAAYRHAIEQRYRFYSYGDAMLIA